MRWGATSLFFLWSGYIYSMLDADHSFNLEELDTKSLSLGGKYFGVIGVLERELEKGEIPSDELLSLIIDTPPIHASARSDEEFRTKALKKAKEYDDGSDERLGIVKLLKKEFYDFLCTSSKHYEKERQQMGGNINLVIVGLASAIAAKFVSLEVGLITSFVTVFFQILAKMGKRVICESFG